MDVGFGVGTEVGIGVPLGVGVYVGVAVGVGVNIGVGVAVGVGLGVAVGVSVGVVSEWRRTRGRSGCSDGNCYLCAGLRRVKPPDPLPKNTASLLTKSR